jgi:FMN phosphatase YigB (HAD superfamily)
MAIYCFDLDGTLCETEKSNYENSKPNFDRIAKVNDLIIKGHRVIIFTARGSTSGFDWTELTKDQLRIWGVLHHELILGKPAADFYIDDKAISDNDFFN